MVCRTRSEEKKKAWKSEKSKSDELDALGQATPITGTNETQGPIRKLPTAGASPRKSVLKRNVLAAPIKVIETPKTPKKSAIEVEPETIGSARMNQSFIDEMDQDPEAIAIEGTVNPGYLFPLANQKQVWATESPKTTE